MNWSSAKLPYFNMLGHLGPRQSGTLCLGRCTRATTLAGLLLAIPAGAYALTQVSGPVMIGPSRGDGNPQNHSATLTTMVVNQGQLADRLVNVLCPSAGDAHLLNGQVRQVGSIERNGLDIPGSIDGKANPVAVQIGLRQATEPVVSGALVPCSLYFQHAGQRVVVFTLGAHEQATAEP